MELSIIIDIIGLSQGIILGVLILINKPTNSSAYTYLGLYLITIGLLISNGVLEGWGLFETYPWLYFVPVNFFFVFPVLLYLYVREISGIPYPKASWRLFWPGLLELCSWSFLLGLSLAGKAPDLESDGFALFEGLYSLGAFIFMIVYLVKIIRFITKVKRRAEDNFSSMNDKTLSWLRVACVLILLTFLLPIIDELVPELALSVFYIDGIINVATLLFLAINGYKQTVVLNLQGELLLTTPRPGVQPEGENARVIPLEADKRSFEDLQKLIEEASLYKRQELTLAELAEEAGLHQKRLSFLINQFSGKNFFNFINEYRVKEAQQLLADKDYEHLSFLGIGFEAGFNSKATFNVSFKKVTGLTPRQFKLSRQSA